MTQYLSFNFEKFTFRIATDRQYSDEGFWMKQEGQNIRLGISDYVQQRNGDVAFVEIKPAGMEVSTGDEIVVLETIKVNTSFSSPVTGKVIEVNPVMESAPEVINQDPYGEGWVMLIRLANAEAEIPNIHDPHSYYMKVKLEVEQEGKTNAE